jgi:hypothetical protein
VESLLGEKLITDVLFYAHQGGTTLEDVSISLSKGEWEFLSSTQRHLYLHVILENFAFITSIGKYVTLWSFLIFFFPESTFPLHC